MPLCPAPFLHEPQELLSDGRDSRGKVSKHLADDALDCRPHGIKRVVHVSDVVYLRFADDDAETLGPGLQLLNAGGTLTEQRSQGGTLLAEDGDRCRRPVGSRWQLRDGFTDNRELPFRCQGSQFRHRQIDLPQALVQFTARRSLADVHGKLLHRCAKLLRIHAGQLGREGVLLQLLNADAGAGRQVVQRVNGRVDIRHKAGDLRGNRRKYPGDSLGTVYQHSANLDGREGADVLGQAIKLARGLGCLLAKLGE